MFEYLFICFNALLMPSRVAFENPFRFSFNSVLRIFAVLEYGDRFLVDEGGFEPPTSAMPTPRSFQTDLLAHFSNN